jgi:hypothetical protein
LASTTVLQGKVRLTGLFLAKTDFDETVADQYRPGILAGDFG